MAGGGFVKLPSGAVVVALSLPRPGGRAAAGGPGPRVRVLVHALNRARALTRVRNLGWCSVFLRGNADPPTPDEVTAVLHHPDGIVWRSVPSGPAECWQPISSLLRPAAPEVRWTLEDIAAPALLGTDQAAEPAVGPGGTPPRQRSAGWSAVRPEPAAGGPLTAGGRRLSR